MTVACSARTVRNSTPLTSHTSTVPGSATRWLWPVYSPRARTAPARLVAPWGTAPTAEIITSPCLHMVDSFRHFRSYSLGEHCINRRRRARPATERPCVRSDGHSRARRGELGQPALLRG